MKQWKLRKAFLRQCAANALKTRYAKVVPKSGQGILPNARWLAFPHEGAGPRQVAIRTSYDREVGATRHTDASWVTIPKMDEVVIAVPSAEDPGSIEVLCFDREVLLSALEAALKERKKQYPNLSHKIPGPSDKPPY